MYRVLIVGCGQLGSRHLQAVAALTEVRQIEIVDERPEALALGRQRLEEAPDRNKDISYRWLSSLDQATPGGDLCIIATQAEGRCQLVEQVAKTLEYSSFLIEKIVAQSVGEYERLMAFSATNPVSVWVNCKTRAYPIHKHVKAKLDPSKPILFSSMGGNHGLANNGVHTADLFVFYDECDDIRSVGASIDPVLHPSKRGDQIYDLSGTLQGLTSKGSRMFISFAGDHVAPEHISILSQSYRCIVDHLSRWAWESDVDAGWEWRPVLFEGNLAVSNMTKAFATDILLNGKCELPTLATCFPAHRFILEELLPHFRQFLGKEIDRCPVT